MRIAEVEIDGLFARFHHRIPFKLEDRITIAHGPNGVGKTTVLRLVADLFSKRFSTLVSVPYEQMRISFENGTSDLVVKKTTETRELEFVLEDGQKIHTMEIDDEHEDGAGYRDALRHRVLKTLEKMEREGLLSGNEKEFGGHESLPDWLENLLGSVHTHFIQTQRLLVADQYTSKKIPISTVEEYSNDIVSRIEDALKDSGTWAASLERTFPHRLLEEPPPPEINEQEIRELYSEQEAYRRRLMQAGLIDAEELIPLPEGRMDENNIKVLWHYLQDVKSKFEIFAELLDKIELFKGIINALFLYKDFRIDKNHGFIFADENGKPIPLNALSSGEQHELVLAYDLLFKVEEKSLILIDEPEISLHVTWQRQFIEDLERIARVADLDFLVATHSPQIVHDHTDLMVALGDEA